MASGVTADGQAQPLRNIDVPAPSLNLKGFQWGTVDEKFEAASISQRAAAVPPVSAASAASAASAPAPVSAPPKDPLPEQIATQISLGEKSKIPPFPLEKFQGAYAGNGFNMIFRPRATPDPKAVKNLTDRSADPENPTAADGPNDNVLELNLTTEQMSFGGVLGDIPNRGFKEMPDMFLDGIPYLQTVQDVTNPKTGLPNSTGKDIKGIHFEPGVWLLTPSHKSGPASIVRMATIPHGTTIHAQGPAPTKNTKTIIGGEPKRPKFDALDTTPFSIGRPDDPSARITDTFISMNAENANLLRLPSNLEKFNNSKTGTKRITTDIILNPNKVLEDAVKDLKILETIEFEVSTGAPTNTGPGGGTANISFLVGPKDIDPPNPVAHPAHMKSKFWIEVVEYKVKILAADAAKAKAQNAKTVKVDPIMPNGCTAPTPKFEVTLPPGGVTADKEITVQGFRFSPRKQCY